MLLVALVLFSCKKSEPAQAEEKAPLVTASYGCAPKTVDVEWYRNDNIAPIIDGLDVLHYPITTNNPEVQKYFNQGLVLSYGFNHAEAARSFYYATKLDPECAMCFGGFRSFWDRIIMRVWNPTITSGPGMPFRKPLKFRKMQP